tara:strand:+ start:163 stop:954 length:792 start_codon:yes stop_codon:yes gene_type:complete
MKTEVRDITPEIAKEMLKRNHRNRKVSESHVNFLTTEMVNGQWLFDGQPIRFAEGGRLLDGQHRLSAIVKSGTTQSFLILSGIDPLTFKVMDTGKNRSSGDVFSIEGIEYSATVSSTTRMIYVLKKGRAESESRKMSNSILLEFYNENPKILEFVKDSHKLYVDFNRVLSHSYISGFKYLMAEKNIVASELFWDKVCTGLGLEVGSPMLALRKRLIEDKMSKSSLSVAEKNALVIKAWNHFRKGNTVKFLKYNKDNEKFPVII